MAVPSVTNAQGQVSVIQMQWSPEAGAKGTFDQYTHFDNGWKLKTKLYDKRDDFTFPIVIFPFISTSNIPASPAHGVTFHNFYVILELVPSIFIDLLDRAQLLTQKPLKQGYVAPMLRSLLQKFYGCHHNRVDRYEISIFHITMDFLLFT